MIQQKFFEIIREENRKGSTVFFSSHILREVQQLCDRVAIIKDGAIIEVADVKMLRENNYKKIAVYGLNLDKSIFNITGVTNLVSKHNKISFFYKGDVNVITQVISKIVVSDVNMEEPTLEEIFMHYYE